MRGRGWAGLAVAGIGRGEGAVEGVEAVEAALFAGDESAVGFTLHHEQDLDEGFFTAFVVVVAFGVGGFGLAGFGCVFADAVGEVADVVGVGGWVGHLGDFRLLAAMRCGGSLQTKAMSHMEARCCRIRG